MQYQPVKYWAKLPHPMLFAEATSVAVDSEDNVYVFNRGKNPLIIFDKEGNFLVSEELSERILSLPMHPYLSDDDVGLIIDQIQ